MNKYKVIAICGKSAAGKDTLLKEIMKLENTNLHEIVSCTTRPPREGEVNGKNYYFFSVEEFLNKVNNNEMLEHTQFREWYYGTSLDSLQLNSINVGVFNVDGIERLYENSNIELYVIKVVASDKTRLLRSLNREKNPDVHEIIRRYTTDEKDFEYFYGENCVVVNEDDSKLYDAARAVLIYAQDFWAKETN